MKIVDEKTSRDALINPRAIKGVPKLDSIALMCAVRPDVDDLVKCLGLKQSHQLPMNKIHFNKDGKGGCVAGPMMGAPYAAYVLEQLIASGAEKILFVGWCGAVSPDLEIGDVIVPSSAFVDEGTSVHYSHREIGAIVRSFPNEDLADWLSGALERQEIEHARKAVWTTDGIYRETPEQIEYFSRQGAAAVEMELSALQSVANFREAALCGVLIVSDELHSGKWKPGFSNPTFQKTRKKVIEALCRICRAA
ncbi:Uridine phosphorylase [Desulfatibacillum alkenivorans DSM 16219]|jgi:purine-nucleoside phosphorylase|uniref:Uridine phosphorylase n=1 Tax=Desulfatibacillum alkenivorans DSM 16219 TaxID=1121393 RepID=A0A1M7A961_9BACT|nr:Uridine phosphorylase [Desulfatibacillum alkenivorans DSM 16219]